MWWSGRRRVASERIEQLGAKELGVLRLAVEAVGTGTRDRKVGSASGGWGRDNKGDDNHNDEVVRDEAIR